MNALPVSAMPTLKISYRSSLTRYAITERGAIRDVEIQSIRNADVKNVRNGHRSPVGEIHADETQAVACTGDMNESMLAKTRNT